MKRTFCFEYYSIVACGLTDLNTWTFESLKKKSLWPFKICIWVPLLWIVIHSMKREIHHQNCKFPLVLTIYLQTAVSFFFFCLVCLWIVCYRHKVTHRRKSEQRSTTDCDVCVCVCVCVVCMQLAWLYFSLCHCSFVSQSSSALPLVCVCLYIRVCVRVCVYMLMCVGIMGACWCWRVSVPGWP